MGKAAMDFALSEERTVPAQNAFRRLCINQDSQDLGRNVVPTELLLLMEETLFFPC